MPAIITLTFKNGYALHCTSVCYSPNSANKGCICSDRNTGLGLPGALIINYNYREDIRRQVFQRFPHAMSVTIKLPQSAHRARWVTFTNPNPIRTKKESLPPSV